MRCPGHPTLLKLLHYEIALTLFLFEILLYLPCTRQSACFHIKYLHLNLHKCVKSCYIFFFCSVDLTVNNAKMDFVFLDCKNKQTKNK